MSNKIPVNLGVLAGTVAVVTGAANKGIGWGLACHAASVLGMHIVIIDLHCKLVDQAAAELGQLCPDVKVLGIAADVTSPEAMGQALVKTQEEFDGVGIGAVFANAGVIFNSTLLKSSLNDWATTLNVNVLGVVNTLQTFLPILVAQDRPAVICPTASVGGLVRGDGGGGAYQASKHAVVALTESLSFELAKKHPHIHVHVLCPCIVQSALPVTSKTNAQVAEGELDEDSLEVSESMGFNRAMTPARHAEQVFDQLQEGNFYIITDNVRPYVDHDKPFNALELIEERMQNVLAQCIDNSDVMKDRRDGPPSAILKGPLFSD